MNMLRSIREKKGLTISQLAARASISARVIGDYEEGRQPIPLSHAKLLAKALWVPIEDLMPLAGSVPPPTYTATTTTASPQAAPQPQQAAAATSYPAARATNSQQPTAATSAPATSSVPPGAQGQPQMARPTGVAGPPAEAQKPLRPTRTSRITTPLTEGQLQELMHLSQRLQIAPEQLEERVGKPLATLTRPDAKEWIKRLRAMADEIAPTQKIRFGQWPEAQEDHEAAYLREQRDAGAPFMFKLFNGEQITGTVSDFTPYTITIRTDAEEEMVLRKLSIAYYRRQPAPDHQPSEAGINSDHAGVPAVPSEDNMDEDRGA